MIAVSGLTKIYGEQRAVDAVSFEVRPGEVLGFLGPNGAGKSTTMKILTGYIPATEGKASVCGYDVETQSLEARRQVGYLPENNPLYTDMYVKEFLYFSGRLNGVKKIKSRVKDLIGMVGLHVEQHKKIHALSRGYRQRVGLAHALLHDPKVLIMDEPTSGLDPNQLAEIRHLIRELGKEKTVVLSTHIMQEVEAICSRVIIINKGKIVADDSVENLQKRKTGEVIISVTFKNPVEKQGLLKVKGVKRAEPVSESSYRVSSSFNNEEEIFQFAVENRNIITSMSHEQTGLEDIFRTLTKDKN